jgi:hypothetical protein
VTKERLRELALDIATANGLLRVLVYSGKPYADAEREYQAAVRAFDAAMEQAMERHAQNRALEDGRVMPSKREMSDTPRTDAVTAKPLTHGCQPMLNDLMALARQLERELNAALRRDTYAEMIDPNLPKLNVK